MVLKSVLLHFFLLNSVIVSAKDTVYFQQDTTSIRSYQLEESVVTASRIGLSLDRSARHITIINSDEITNAPVQHFLDLFNFSAGVDLLQRGGHGVQADISIRGGSFDQTAVLLNGINLSNPQTGHYNMDLPINTNDIERIEIIHGPSSIMYGASAFAGGVNIITRKRPDHKLYSKIEVGGYKLFGVEAGCAFGSEKINNRLSIGYSRSDGYIYNSDYKIANLLWQTRINVDENLMDIQVGVNDKRYGANTFYSAEYPDQYDETQSYFLSVKGQTGGRLKIVPQIYWHRHYDSFQLFREGTPNIPEWYTDHNYHRTDVYGSNINFQYEWKWGTTSFGAEFRNEGIVSSVLGDIMNEPFGKYKYSDDRTNISYFAEHTLSLKRVTLSAGVMANYNTAIKGDYNFYPSINASYNLSDHLNLYLSWNRSTRMPTFTDLYYSSPTHSSNPYLKPEYSEGIEGGLKFRNHIFNAYVTLYYMEGNNLIDWIKESAESKWQSVNYVSIYKKGIECGVNLDLRSIAEELFLPGTFIRLDYSRMHQDGESRSEEIGFSYLLNYLRDKFVAQINLPLFKERLCVNIRFRVQKRVGNYFQYNPEDKEYTLMPYIPFSTMDVALNYKLSENIGFNININNLYNTHYFDLGNIPQAGFWLTGGVKIAIR